MRSQKYVVDAHFLFFLFFLLDEGKACVCTVCTQILWITYSGVGTRELGKLVCALPRSCLPVEKGGGHTMVAPR